MGRPSRPIDPRLVEFARSDVQRRKIEAAIRHNGDLPKAAAELGTNLRNLEKVIAGARLLAELRGYAPLYDQVHAVPESQIVRGVSTLYDTDGNVSQQWVKTNIRQEAYAAALRAAIDALSESIPRAKPVAPPKRTEGDLLNCYVITDYHIGGLAWGEETRGEDWDSGIAEDLLYRWFAVAVAESPRAEVGLLAQLGDLVHIDGLDAVTPTSRNLLDADTRFQRIVRVVIRVLRRVIAALLAKHDRVVIVHAEGNHDIASSAWLREVFAAFYDTEPRVTVDISPDPYYCYEHGLTSLFFHHGHLRKPGNVDSTFAGKFRDVFGRTKHSYAHMGHMHHFKAQETPLMVVQQHRTLAASDAYASRGGWVSGRDAEVITYSKRFGKVGSLTISPDRARAGNE